MKQSLFSTQNLQSCPGACGAPIFIAEGASCVGIHKGNCNKGLLTVIRAFYEAALPDLIFDETFNFEHIIH